MDENTTLPARVDRALDTAVFEQCNTSLMFRGPLEVAADLCAYDRTFVTEEAELVANCVMSYQNWYEAEARETKRTDSTEGV